MNRDYVVVSRAPLRVSLAGGGTDLPGYAGRYGGLILSAAIDKFVAVAAFPREFDGNLTVSLEGITHRTTHVATLDDRFARSLLERAGARSNRQLSSFSDVPSGTGLGASGAFSVSTLNTLFHPRDVTARELAEEAHAVEAGDLRRNVGKHDHYMAAFGGLRALDIRSDGYVECINLDSSGDLTSYLDESLLLFYTGHRREAHVVLAAQEEKSRRGHSATLESLRAIHALAKEMLNGISARKIDDLGEMLDEHWRRKRNLSERVSTPGIDRLYRAAIDAGARGGKIVGAGGGGFLLLAVPGAFSAEVREAMHRAGARELTFRFEKSGATRVALPL
jgi:D-glycero-alpha-D-manno-heptose-7-phosphate kinase